MRNKKFENLFIFDVANNHQGDFEHCKNIINEFSKVVKKYDVKALFKFQFRDLETFIHPDKINGDNKHIKRFLDTKLEKKEIFDLVDFAKSNGFYTMSTPFDENSVDLCNEIGHDYIKIASCSILDKPLIEKIIKLRLPTVVSTGGTNQKQIDSVVFQFLENKIDFALEHCVSIYPTPNNKLNLFQIKKLKERFPELTIGWSTHEDPNDFTVIKTAYALGARIFERHIGIENEKYKLNNYSSNPKQIDCWLNSFKEVVDACGGENRSPSSEEEKKSLNDLKRGIYAKTDISKGEQLTKKNIFYAFPAENNKLSTFEWSEKLIANRDYKKNSSFDLECCNSNRDNQDLLNEILLQVKGLLKDASINFGKNSKIEISHHYGLEKFREFGAVLIDVINREYCKKLVIQLPRQKHPYHHHKVKEETFQVLFGDLRVEKDGKIYNLDQGDTLLVKPGEWHKFSTLSGVVFEEISTTHVKKDSIYEDDTINKLKLEERKTYVTNWLN